MTDTLPETAPAKTMSTWDQEFAKLKARFPHAKDTIVFCIHAMQSNPDITLDDLKAQASLHGIRVTAASLTAAQRLLAPAPTTTPTMPATPTTVAPARPAPVRRPRPADPTMDAEALIRQVVGKLQNQGNAEAERLREAIRRAIAVLQAAVG